jgi:hypothetical protein
VQNFDGHSSQNPISLLEQGQYSLAKNLFRIILMF